MSGEEVRKRRAALQKRCVRIVCLSLALTLTVLAIAGCAANGLLGKDRIAYDAIVQTEDFSQMKSVKLLSGSLYGGDVYGHLYMENQYGRTISGLYKIDTDGRYARPFEISIYTLEESDRALEKGVLDTVAINEALKAHYKNPFREVFEMGYYGMYSDFAQLTVLLVVVLALGLNGLLASKASTIAEEKGYAKRTWFHMCFWLSLFAYILVAAMPDKVLRQKQEETNLLLGKLLDAYQDGDKTALPPV